MSAAGSAIAVVVIGGSAVAGGNSNVPGIWGASLFMFLVVSMLNTYGFGAGVRLILTAADIGHLGTVPCKQIVRQPDGSFKTFMTSESKRVG